MDSKVKNHIIWDLSGTLFRPSTLGLSQEEIADLSLVFYMWSGKKTVTKFDEAALECINRAEPPIPEYQVIRLHNGEPVPALVCLLLANLITSHEALMRTLENLSLPTEFTQEEQAYVIRLIIAFFTPESLSYCVKPIAPSLEILKLCARHRKNKLYILSNWDAESFSILTKLETSKDVLSHFKPENIMISADIGYIKPQPEVFHYFLAINNLDPETCFFIDDQEENIAGAKTFAIEGIVFKENDTHDILKRMKELSLIE